MKLFVFALLIPLAFAETVQGEGESRQLRGYYGGYGGYYMDTITTVIVILTPPVAIKPKRGPTQGKCKALESATTLGDILHVVFDSKQLLQATATLDTNTATTIVFVTRGMSRIAPKPTTGATIATTTATIQVVRTTAVFSQVTTIVPAFALPMAMPATCTTLRETQTTT